MENNYKGADGLENATLRGNSMLALHSLKVFSFKLGVSQDELAETKSKILE
jgi:hypothetical protein